MTRDNAAAMIRTAVCACALAALVCSQEPGDSDGEPLGSIAAYRDPAAAFEAAKALVGDGKAERGIAMLWTLLRLAPTLPEVEARAGFAADVRAALESADPQADAFFSTMEGCAKRVAGLARAYRQKKWVELATRQLAAAEAFDVARCRVERRSIEREGGGVVEATATAPVRAPELLRASQRRWASDSWETVDDLRTDAEREDPRSKPIPGIRSKGAPGTNVHEVWATKGEHADHQIVVEFRPDRDGLQYEAAVAFGEGGREFMVAVYYDDRARLRISRLADKNWGELAGREGPRDVPLPAWQRLVVQIRGTNIRATLNDGAPLELTVDHAPRGTVSVSVCSDEAQTPVVGFRQLEVAALPEEAPADDGGDAGPDAARVAALCTDIEYLRSEGKRKQGFSLEEPASRDLWDALVLARQLPEGKTRAGYCEELVELLEDCDPVARKRQRAVLLVAEELLELAKAYAEKPGLALILVRRAAEWDADGTTAALTAAEAAASGGG